MTNENGVSFSPSTDAIKWLADIVLYTTGIFLSSKVTLNCRVVSVYGNKNGSGNIPQIFDRFSATLGDPLETVFEELSRSDDDWPFPSFAENLCLGHSDWAPLSEWIPIDQALHALASPPRQSTLCTAAFPKWILDSKEHREWLEGNGHQLLYVHGASRQSVIEAAEQIVAHYKGSRRTKGTSGIDYFSFAFSSHDRRRSSIASMITTYLAQEVPTERSTDGYNLLIDLFAVQNAWTREDLLGLLSTGWWFSNTDGVIVFLQDFDECDENDRSLFLNIWNKMANTIETPLKLVVTSRRQGTLRAELRDWPVLEVNEMHSDTTSGIASGMQASSFDKRLESLCRYCYSKKDEFKIRTRVQELFDSSNDGRTQDTILDLIQDHSEWPVEPSEASLARFISLLDQMSVGISAESALDIILKSNGEGSTLKTALTWILYSWQPLSIWELAILIDSNNYSPNQPDSVDPMISAQIHALSKIRTWFRGMLNESHGEIRLKSKIRRAMHHDGEKGTNYIWDQPKSEAYSTMVDFCLKYLGTPRVCRYLESQYEIYISRIRGSEGLATPLVPHGRDLIFYVVQCLPHCLSHLKSNRAEKIYKMLTKSRKSLDAWAKIWWAMSNPFSRPRECPTSAEVLLIQLDLFQPRRRKYLADLEPVLIGALTGGHGAKVDGILKSEDPPHTVLISALSTAVKIGRESTAISIASKILANEVEREATKLVIEWPHTIIWRAAWLGLDRLAKLLLETGADANGGGVISKSGFSPLAYACHAGHATIATLLLSYGAQTDRKIGGTAYCVLHFASRLGYYPEITESLLRKDRNGLLEYGKPDTPLYAAAVFGNWQTIVLLLQHGADPDTRVVETNHNYRTWSPLSVACARGLAKTMKALLDGHADPNTRAPWGQDTPLWFVTVASANVEHSKILLDAGADPNHELFQPPLMVEIMRSSHESSEAILEVSNVLLHHKQPIRLDDVDTTDGQTALMYASRRRRGGSTLVHWLLENGVDINATDFSGKSAVFHAIEAGNVAVVEELLSWNRVDLRIKLKTAPRTVLEAALTADTDDSSINCALVDKLIAAGADPEINIDNGARILNLAVQKGNTEVVQTLIAHNVKLDHRDRLGWMPIHDAVGYSSNAKIVRLLAEAGASLRDVLELSGRSVLHMAMTEDSDILVILLQFHRDLDLERQDCDGNTPLLTTGIRLECARLMIQAGADVNARNNMGDTPLAKAVRTYHNELVDLLMSESNTELWPALHDACREGHVDLVMKLLDHATKAHVNQQLPINYSTPLLAAIIPRSHLLDHRNFEDTQRIVRALIDKGANVNDTVSVPHSAIFYSAITAAAFLGPPACIALLLNEGVKGQTSDPLKRLPIHFAAAGGVQNLQMVSLTGWEKFDTTKDVAGKTCLHWAAQHGRARAVEAIIGKMSNKERITHVNEPDIDGWTPLCWAMRTSHEGRSHDTAGGSDPIDYLSTVKHLIKHGADISVECVIQKGVRTEAESFTLHKIARRYGASSDVINLISSGQNQEEEDIRPYNSQGKILCNVCFCYVDGQAFSCDVCIDFWVCNKCYGRINLYHIHFKTENSQPHTFTPSPNDEFECLQDLLETQEGTEEGSDEDEGYDGHHADKNESIPDDVDEASSDDLLGDDLIC
ncbi:ankyrin repeat-containing domain protein [Nemania sp. NC0429]|nr:ankyrin repeat-containing domain protein [Nemania sp. NC0429]